ncbi:hypothetical protein WT15_27440 [Burkholderia stagnalis]|uniref:tail fiber domain-containing protein n=1 Tax=Burkholderia stagnalis TaxID=1503054 RepID=UPI000758C319|nr:tail fiber domain-containing protein [Burkholderia stagnalis]KVN72812.1 hypothetical protein WT15_27440 [Burkholderia stagnalis]KWO38192.1 hypothetical protein WT96_12805 [Burkholderia stagnalis]KWO41086.1 hypothetical protein WT95_03040 [Burkholderia stagnalis]
MRHCFELPDLPALAFRKALGKNRPATLEGGGKGGSAPSSPDPWVVSAAQTAQNNATAEFSKSLNLNNYSNPFGSQQSQVVSYDPKTGAPIYNTSITANPQLHEAIGNLLTQTGASGGITTDAINGIGSVGQGYGALGSGIAALNPQLAAIGASLNPQAAQAAQKQGRDAAYASQTQYLDPRFSQQQTSLESQLANQGLTPGSQAYDNAFKNFNLSKNQAYSDAANQAVLTGSQIGTQNWQNQISGAQTQGSLIGQQGSLFGLGGSMLGQQANLYGQRASLAQLPYSNLSTLASLVPGNTGTAQSATSPANIAQAFQNQYQGQLNAYNAQTASANSTMGGLFGLGSVALGALALSDRRVKTDIERIGPLSEGIDFYRFRYRHDPTGATHYGVMADEVRRVRPDAVYQHPSGYAMVDYAKIGAAHHAG